MTNQPTDKPLEMQPYVQNKRIQQKKVNDRPTNAQAFRDAALRSKQKNTAEKGKLPTNQRTSL